MEIAGAVVSVTGDVSPLRASDAEARRIVGDLTKLSADIPIRLDLSGLERQIGQLRELIARGTQGVSLGPGRIAAGALPRPLIATDAEQRRPMRLVPASGSSTDAPLRARAPVRGVAASDDRADELSLRRGVLNRRTRLGEWDREADGEARRRGRDTDAAVSRSVAGDTSSQQRLEDRLARAVERGMTNGVRQQERQTRQERRLIQEEASDLHETRLRQRRSFAGGGGGGGNGGGGTFAGGGGGGRGRGGITPYTNIFSTRGFGRLVGSATGAFAVVEAMRVGAGMLEANRVANDPNAVLQGMWQPGALHDARFDPFMAQRAGTLASIRAQQMRMQTMESIPLLGAGAQLFDALTGTSHFLSTRTEHTAKEVEAHQRALQVGDDAEATLAGFSADPRKAIGVTIDRRNRMLRNLGDGDPATENPRAFQLTQAQNYSDYTLGVRLYGAKLTGNAGERESVFAQGQALRARGDRDPEEQLLQQRKADRATLEASLKEEAAKIRDDNDRARVESDNTQRLANFDTETGVVAEELRRQRAAGVMSLRGENEAIGFRGEQVRFEGQHQSLQAFDASRQAERTTSLATLDAKIKTSKDRDEIDELRKTADKLFGREDVRTGQRGGGEFDVESQTRRKLIQEQFNAEVLRLDADTAANRLRIAHDTAGAEVQALVGVKQAAELISDQAVRKAMVVNADSQIALAQQRQREETHREVVGAQNANAEQLAQASRDPFAASRAAMAERADERLTAAGANPVKRGIALGRNQVDEVATEAQLGRAHAVQMTGLQADIEASNQFTAGQYLRSPFTRRIGNIESQVLSLPSGPNLSPEAKAERDKGVEAATSELTAMKSELTGRHGGAVVRGETDAGEAAAQVLEARVKGGQEKLVAGDIDAAMGRIKGNGIGPDGLFGAPPGAAGPGGPSPGGGGGSPTAQQISDVIKKIEDVAKTFGDFLARVPMGPIVRGT